MNFHRWVSDYTTVRLCKESHSWDAWDCCKACGISKIELRDLRDVYVESSALQHVMKGT